MDELDVRIQFHLATMTYVEILVGLLFTILGSVISLLIPYFTESHKNKKRSDLVGEWFSLSHGGADNLVRDKISIQIKRGKFLLRNSDNKLGYSYEATCSIQSGSVLTGSWRSTRPGAHAKGELVLMISPQGNWLYGIYSGVDTAGAPKLLGWVMGRSEQDLAIAERQLEANIQLPTSKT